MTKAIVLACSRLHLDQNRPHSLVWQDYGLCHVPPVKFLSLRWNSEHARNSRPAKQPKEAALPATHEGCTRRSQAVRDRLAVNQ